MWRGSPLSFSGIEQSFVIFVLKLKKTKKYLITCEDFMSVCVLFCLVSVFGYACACPVNELGSSVVARGLFACEIEYSF